MSNFNFRAWDKINKTMLYMQEKEGSVSVFTDGTREVRFDVVFFNLNGNDFEKLADTGLRDNLNNVIYDGDIVQLPNGKVRVVFSVPGGYAVEALEMDVGRYGTIPVVPIEGLSDMQNASWIQQFEIVGNRYENPSLLNVPVKSIRDMVAESRS